MDAAQSSFNSPMSPRQHFKLDAEGHARWIELLAAAGMTFTEQNQQSIGNPPTKVIYGELHSPRGSFQCELHASTNLYQLIITPLGGVEKLEILEDLENAFEGHLADKTPETQTAIKRGCYCRVWNTNPAHFESLGVPRGYCGLCKVCGRPGHTRHFPGAVPYTGSWCDFHYRMASLFHPLGFPGTLLYFGIVVAGLILWFVFKH